MGPKTPVTEGDFFRQPLREQINLKHPLVCLTDLIDWDRLGAPMSTSFVRIGDGRNLTAPDRRAAVTCFAQVCSSDSGIPITFPVT